MDETEARQLVYEQLAENSARSWGPRRLRERIASKGGVHLPRCAICLVSPSANTPDSRVGRDFISKVMHEVDPEGFALRHPLAKKGDIGAPQIQPTSGPNMEWTADGNDKLLALGLPIIGIKDTVTRFELLLRVVPQDRFKLAFAYLWLSVVKERGGWWSYLTPSLSRAQACAGFPLQKTSGDNAETVMVTGLVNALRSVGAGFDTS